MKKAMPLPLQEKLVLGSGHAIFLDPTAPKVTDETNEESDTESEEFYDAGGEDSNLYSSEELKEAS